MKTTTDFWTEIADHGVQAMVDRLTDQESMDMTWQFGTHNYRPLPVNIVRAEGAKVWDGTGKEYIDCIGAYSAVSHGHLNPAAVKAATEQLKKVAVVSRAFYASEVALFLKALSQYAEMDKVCPMNTGAEAVETCIKLARKWGYVKKEVPLDQAEIIVCQDNFHGRTTTIVGFSTEEKYKKLFGPYTPGFKIIPFGDADALRKAITPNTVAFLSEPIQAEGGILIPPTGWMSEVREICTQNNVLLIWDEIQTGFCRTGEKFAWQHELSAKPDLMAVGKPLGGGLLPVSAAIGSNDVMELFVPGDHGSTFGGNPLGSAVAIAALAEMETKNYRSRSKEMGAKAVEFLQSMEIKQVKEVRGRGLLIGIEVDETVDTDALSNEFVARGLLTKQTRNRTFRLTPPLMINPEVLEDALHRFRDALLAVCS